MTPINGWTKQAMIDHVKANFKGKSVDSDGACLYRGPDGRRCAVGLFIPDGEFVSTNGSGVIALLSENEHLRKFMPLPTEGLMGLQGIHDGSRLEERTDAEILEEMINWIKEKVE